MRTLTGNVEQTGRNVVWRYCIMHALSQTIFLQLRSEAVSKFNIGTHPITHSTTSEGEYGSG